MSISIKNLIIKRASLLKSEIEELELPELAEKEDEIIPEITESNLIELTNLFLFLFPSTNTEKHLRELCIYKKMKISENSIEILVPILDKFVVFIKKVYKFIVDI